MSRINFVIVDLSLGVATTALKHHAKCSAVSLLIWAIDIPNLPLLAHF